MELMHSDLWKMVRSILKKEEKERNISLLPLGCFYLTLAYALGT
jgi:hypothetical protein